MKNLITVKQVLFVIIILLITSSCAKEELNDFNSLDSNNEKEMTSNMRFESPISSEYVKNWTPGGGAGFGAGCEEVWGVGFDGRVYKWNGTGWTEPAPAARLHTVYSVWGAVWGLGVDKRYYKWNGTGWTEPSPGVHVSFLMPYNGNIAYSMPADKSYVLRTTNGGVTWSYYCTNNVSIASISVSYDGTLWALGGDFHIYTYNYLTGWTEPCPTATLGRLNAGFEIWGTGENAGWPNYQNGRVFRWNRNTNGWDEPCPAARLEIVAATKGCTTWGLSSEGRVFCWDEASLGWTEPAPAARLSHISVGN